MEAYYTCSYIAALHSGHVFWLNKYTQYTNWTKNPDFAHCALESNFILFSPVQCNVNMKKRKHIILCVNFLNIYFEYLSWCWKTIRSNFCTGMHGRPSIILPPEIIGKHFYFSVNYNIKKLPWLMPLVLWNYIFNRAFIVCDWKHFCCVVQHNEHH